MIDIDTVFSTAGDGISDDTAKFASAIAQLTTNGGGTLQLGAKTYLIKTAGNGFSVPSNSRIVGIPGKTIILLDNNTPSISSPPYGGVFSAIGVNNVVFQDFEIKRNSAILSNLIIIDNCDNIRFQNVKFNGQMSLYSGNAFCHGIRYGNSGGISHRVTNIVVESCEFTDMSFSIYMMNDSTSTIDGFLVQGCSFHDNLADDVNFNCPNGSFTRGQVIGNRFNNGLSTSNVGGFAIDFANIQHSLISGNVIKDYPFNGIHLEDRTAHISITGNVLTNCAKTDESVIQLISGVSCVSITGNTITQTVPCGGSRQSSSAIYIGPGGGEVTPSRITISGNNFSLGDTWGGIDAFSVARITVTGNHFEGSGAVNDGSYAGGSNNAVSIVNGGPATVSGNYCLGMNSFIPGTTSTFRAMSGSITGNTIEQCKDGMNLQPTGNCLVSGNYFVNCVHSIASGSNGVTTAQPAVIAMNYATGCANAMDAGYGPFWGGTSEAQRLVAFNCDDSLGVHGFPIQGFMGSSEKLAIISDADAVNDSLYYSTTQHKPCYKDGAGTPNPLC